MLFALLRKSNGFLITFVVEKKIMGLKMRITYKDTDYVYEIINGAGITKDTAELKILLNGKTVTLQKNTNKVWMQEEGEFAIEPELAQALGRSVSSTSMASQRAPRSGRPKSSRWSTGAGSTATTRSRSPRRRRSSPAHQVALVRAAGATGTCIVRRAVERGV